MGRSDPEARRALDFNLGECGAIERHGALIWDARSGNRTAKTHLYLAGADLVATYDELPLGLARQTSVTGKDVAE